MLVGSFEAPWAPKWSFLCFSAENACRFPKNLGVFAMLAHNKSVRNDPPDPADFPDPPDQLEMRLGPQLQTAPSLTLGARMT